MRENRTFIVKHQRVASPLQHAEEEQERRTRPLATANRIADQIVKDLAKM